VSRKFILEYVWLDGYEAPNLRSKIKVIEWPEGSRQIELKDIPCWNFDGSSTQQAPGAESECMLTPIRLYGAQDHLYVLCEVYSVDGSPHQTNTRSKLAEQCDKVDAGCNFWWGFEQEYFITQDRKILGFPSQGFPEPQGRYYCGVGTNQVIGRDLATAHMHFCLQFGIDITGINAEVAIGQWEFQCFSKDTLKACDDLWMSRYFLYKLAEASGRDIDISPKPVLGDWNGSGCHTNFSTEKMRNVGGEEYLTELMNKFAIRHDEHILCYGSGNEKRLTGKHETQKIDQFSWGVGDRGASIRIPNEFRKNNWTGYVEDRRPASNADPYAVAFEITKTTLWAEELETTPGKAYARGKRLVPPSVY